MSSIIDKLKERFERYRSYKEARDWLNENYQRVEQLFSDPLVRDFVFEPIKGVFDKVSGTDVTAIRAVITRVAVVNAVMAGLPGKLGIGVVVSMGLEGWMAYVIAKRMGIEIKRVDDIWSYFGILTGSAVMILYGFRMLLGLAYSTFSIVPGLNPLIFAELFTTNLVGVLFWVGFRELARKGKFTIPISAFKEILVESRNLYDFQYSHLKASLSLDKLQNIGNRLRVWFDGNIPLDKAHLRGEVFTTIAMSWLLSAQYGRLDGPLGKEFILAIRDRYPELADASIDEIADFMSNYDAEQMAGVTNLIKGKLFERLVTRYENADGDVWVAHMYSDESHPDSDIIFLNTATGEQIDISLKATDDPQYIEEALRRYPDTPILTTDEVAASFADSDRVIDSGISNDDLNQVTEDNFDTLLEHLPLYDVGSAHAGGITARAIFSLWPFVRAWSDKRITDQQMEQAFLKVMGKSGSALASRISYSAILGPVYAWYMLARGVMAFCPNGEPETEPVSRAIKTNRHLEIIPSG